MKKLTKILSAILVIVLCVQIIVPGTLAIGATPFVGNNVAKSASEGISLRSQGDAFETAEIDAEIPVNDSSNENSDSKITTPILGEVEELRTENTKHYRHKDGTYTAAIYPEPIHYMDSTGSWQDIDNTLTLNSKRKSVAGKATYTPAASALDIRIPQDFSGGQMLTIGKDGYTVGMRIKTSDNSSAMSMSANATASRASSATAVIDNNFASMEAESVSSAADTTVSSDSAVELANKEEMKLDKKVSAVNYNDAFNGADLQYVITPSKVKENIIVTETQNSYVYQFELDLDGLVPVSQNNGSIRLYEDVEDEEALFVIETPYMYDANDDTSFDVTMSLNGNILTVTADSEWINDENRAFPVVIDPTLSTAASTFHDATANQNTPIMNFESYIYLYAGNGFLNLRRTYLKFDLPHLPEGSVVTDAKLQMVQHDVELANSSTKLIAFDLPENATWSDSSLTWNNQPLSKEKNGPLNDGNLKRLDYELFKVENAEGQIYSFNLTKAVKNWYEGVANNGIMITSSNEEENSQTTLYSSNHSDTSLNPSVTIEYTNNIGLEDYWTYETVDLGRSGSLYANPYNGAVTYVHNDISMTGNRLPISISHIYNNNISRIYTNLYVGMNLGQNFHLNIQEVVLKVNSNKYKHFDSDGTIHYYLRNSATGKITHEYDPTKVLTTDSSGYIITDGQNNKKIFNANGQLIKLVDKNNNQQVISIINGRIKKVTDSVGRHVTFDYYDNSILLESITDPSGRALSFEYIEIDSVIYLSRIKYSDNKSTSFSYQKNIISDEISKYILNINAFDGSSVNVSYTSNTLRSNRIDGIKNYDKASQLINWLDFKYTESNASGVTSGNTVVTNYLDLDKNNLKSAKVYLFDVYGRAISITNEDSQTQYEIFGSDANKADYNKIQTSSELQTIVTNLLKNHGFERGNTYWSALQTVSNGSWGIINDQSKSSRGNFCLKLELSENTGVYEVDQDFPSTAGQTYTVSVDINIPEALSLSGNNGASFGFVYCVNGEWKTDSSRLIGSTNGWERFSHTATLPNGNISNCHVFLELAQAKGTVYFDNVQVEKSGGSRFYNLVENSDFSNVTGSSGTPVAASAYAWTNINCQSADGVYFRDWGNRNFFEMTGSTEKAKGIYQIVPVNAKAGDTLIIGGRAAAYASGGTSNGRTFDIAATLYGNDGNYIETVKIEYDRTINQERQIRATSYTLTEDCYNIYLYFRYYYQTGPLSIDDLFVYVGNFGDHYAYTDDGLTDRSYNDEGKTTQYSYDNNNVTEIIEFTSESRYLEYKDPDMNNENDEQNSFEIDTRENVGNFDYDSNHNVTEATNNIGTTIDYEYIAGQVTKQTTKFTDDNNQEKTIVESFSYYQGGNYIKAFTDETGGVTTYYYDYDDPNAVHDSGTEYEPVITKGLVTSVRDPNGNITSYTYDPNTDELISVSGNAEPSVPSTVSFTYENGLPKTITRNGTTYSYAYDAQNRVTSSKVGTQTLTTNSYDSRQRLSQVAYANSAVYTPVYDSRDRLAGDSWNGNQISEYYYNENDRLSKHVDNVTDVSYQYDYAFYGLPFRITGSDGTQTTFDYDKSGTLARLTFGDENDTIYSGKYYTNEKGKPEDVLIDTLDNAVLHYNYDGFGRVEDCSYGPMVRTYQYAETSIEGNTVESNKVIEIVDKNKNDRYIQKYDYEYNEDGSLYCYDDIVKREYYDFIYDDLGRVIENYLNGDLLEYNYDAAGNLSTVIYNLDVLHTYTYGNQNWKDQLTAFDGKAITYDANGNPLSYDGYTYSWQRGTQLASITGNGKNISYLYDSQGHRVQKTVNGVTTSYLYSGDLLMRQTDGTNTLDFQYDASGYMVGFVYNGTPYYYLRNVLNDISGIVDGEGTVVARYVYDAYGNTVLATGSMAAINPIRYRGYYFDSETNWYYLESRYYNPEWCRFISPDCLFVAGEAVTGSNMYAYCNNNPTRYIDSTGSVPELNVDLNSAAEGVRIVSGYLSKILTPITDNLFSGITDAALADLKKVFKNEENFALSPFMVLIGTPLLCVGSIVLLPILDAMIDPSQQFPNSPEFKLPTGIRHLTPWSMKFLVGFAEYFLGFESDGNGNYTTDPSKFMWQSMVGYNWFYDYFFSLGGPIDRVIIPFEAKLKGSDKTAYYAVWCWKADYWNLGAGAEIGVYWQPIKTLAERGFYRVDQTNLLIQVNMQVTYDHSKDILTDSTDLEILTGSGTNDTSLKQKSWWITTFSPRIQFAKVDAINVYQAVKFVESGIHDNLFESLYSYYNSNGKSKPDEVSWSASGSQWDYLNNDTNCPYEFYIQY